LLSPRPTCRCCHYAIEHKALYGTYPRPGYTGRTRWPKVRPHMVTRPKSYRAPGTPHRPCYSTTAHRRILRTSRFRPTDGWVQIGLVLPLSFPTCRTGEPSQVALTHSARQTGMPGITTPCCDVGRHSDLGGRHISPSVLNELTHR
jgi:hypothetical protein